MLDRLLGDEISWCLARIAVASPEGTLAFITACDPALRGRLEEAEARLAALRAEILERYAAWQAALGEMENLWALGALKRAESAVADGWRSAA